MSGSGTSSQSQHVGRSLRMCYEHGDPPLCYVQADESHIPAASCTCRRAPSSACPIDAHHELCYDSDEFGEWGRVFGVRSPV